MEAETQCTCKEHDPYCCQVHGSCPTCVKKGVFKQLTAVEWLLAQISLNGFQPKHIEEAKEMEKQQIINAFQNGYYECENNSQDRQMTKKQYYDETFNKK